MRDYQELNEAERFEPTYKELKRALVGRVIQFVVEF